MNLLEKLQKIRVVLRSKKLKKTGRNNHTGFDYFELEDFMPTVLQLCDEASIFTAFSLFNERADLRLIEYGLPQREEIVFSIPSSKLVIPKANEIQNIGGTNTYLKRYLYINAFEICEFDEFDKNMGETMGKDQKSANTLNGEEPDSKIKNPSIEVCQFGKNKGKLWDSMEGGTLDWYRGHFEEKVSKGGKYAEQDGKVLSYLNILLTDADLDHSGELPAREEY